MNLSLLTKSVDNITMPESQRALIFQGDGSLAAFEAGAFRAFYEILTEQSRDHEALFDIVVGTSMGAVNAAILVNHVIHNNNRWSGSADKLEQFWRDISSDSSLDNPFFRGLWNYLHQVNPAVASPEEAIRHYSSKEAALRGLPKIFSGPVPVFDSKFLDPQNVWYRYDNLPLQKSIRRFIKYPIRTHPPQPRLLLTSADVQSGKTTVFDSYTGRSTYEENEVEYTISYEGGIDIEHLMACTSVPLLFDYAKLKDEKSGNLRYFWNGNLSGSSPLGELIRSHKEFWKEHGSQQPGEKIIPELEVYMVNVWPSEEQHIPYDHDGITDRRNDMIFHGKVSYDQKVAITISDYINLAKRLEELVLKHANETKNAEERDRVNKDLERLLHTKTLSTFHSNKEFTLYLDLVREQCIVKTVICIQREDEFNLTSNYLFRFFWWLFTKPLLERGYAQGRKSESEIRRTSLL